MTCCCCAVCGPELVVCACCVRVRVPGGGANNTGPLLSTSAWLCTGVLVLACKVTRVKPRFQRTPITLPWDWREWTGPGGWRSRAWADWPSTVLPSLPLAAVAGTFCDLPGRHWSQRPHCVQWIRDQWRRVGLDRPRVSAQSSDCCLSRAPRCDQSLDIPQIYCLCNIIINLALVPWWWNCNQRIFIIFKFLTSDQIP